MKQILSSIILLLTSTVSGQQMTLEQWNEEAKTNIRLLPEYGHIQKTERQKQTDKEFIETVLKQDSSLRKASDNYINFGFHYLYHDVKTAMYRFNQAYLLDSTNTDIYWGFGAIYTILGDYTRAAEQYKKGLSMDPYNTHLLTDYGTVFLAQYYELHPMDEKSALSNLEHAITHLLKSYTLDPTDQNTTFKLSICYYNKKECENAWKYYEICQKSGGRPITEEYTKDLKKMCIRTE